MKNIVLVNNGRCNLGSFSASLRRINVNFEIVNSVSTVLEEADKIILPGVSSFDACVHALKENGIYDFLKDKNNIKGKKILGICAGAQILFEKSEEGQHSGFGFLEGIVKKIRAVTNLKVPHLGWNHIYPMTHSFALFENVNFEKKFYFSHSYHFPDSGNIQANTNYGYMFPVIVSNDFATAIQFHPEKSYLQGLQLLKNFCEL